MFPPVFHAARQMVIEVQSESAHLYTRFHSTQWNDKSMGLFLLFCDNCRTDSYPLLFSLVNLLKYK